MKFNYYKIGYGIFSLLAGLTVGVLLALFVGLSTFFNSLIAFPVQIYKQCVQVAHTKRMEKLFGLSENHQFGDFKQPSEESIWDKHIERMEEKKARNQNEN